MKYLLPILVLVVGLIAGAVGAIAMCDPEGRGSKYFLLLPLGAIFGVLGASWLVWVRMN